jgi:hypothetical protein
MPTSPDAWIVILRRLSYHTISVLWSDHNGYQSGRAARSTGARTKSRQFCFSWRKWPGAGLFQMLSTSMRSVERLESGQLARGLIGAVRARCADCGREVNTMKINRRIAAGIDPHARQLGDQMMRYMADRQAMLNSGMDVELDAIFRLVRASFSGLWAV